MAVYTAIDDDALQAWVAGHGVGRVVECQGIASGIENSNWFVTTTGRNDVRDEVRDEVRDGVGDVGRSYVLTLFERLSIEELPYYLNLMQHLAARGIPCPAPVADAHGALCSPLAGKPAALVTRLAGRSVLEPRAAHGAALGRQLARMHRAAEGFDDAQPNPRGCDWMRETASRVRDVLDDAQRDLLDAEIAEVALRWNAATAALPRGAIHADVFRDNVLFDDTRDASDAIVVGGIIDFYFAGTDCFVLDLAICLNDWCIDLRSGAFDEDALDAFVAAYRSERPLTPAEHAAMPLALRAAALRFWLSRVDDLHRPRPAQLLTPHDPAHFERILRRRRAEALAGSSPFMRAA